MGTRDVKELIALAAEESDAVAAEQIKDIIREREMLYSEIKTLRKESAMRCHKCGSINLAVVKSGPHNKLVCADCLAFQKFLNAGDARTFLQLQTRRLRKEVTS